MKKILLSLSVIGVFIAYAFHEKQESDSIHVSTPQGLQSNSVSPTPSSAGQASSPSLTNDEPQDDGTGHISTTPSTVPTVTATPTPASSQGQYRDGEYTGSVADAFYGNMQVKVVIQGGRINDVVFLQYPNDRSTSIMINEQAVPYLKQEAIQAQTAHVDIISGATDSSQAFQQSLQSALDQAKG